jgi:hypothetical protein
VLLHVPDTRESLVMVTEPSGIATTVMVILGPVLLLAALIYGTMAYRRRSQRLKQVGDAKTERLFRQEDR